MNVSIAIISILCLNGSTMHTNEENQRVLQSDRSQGRQEVQAQDYTGTTGQDAVSKAKRERPEALVGRTYGKITILEIVGRTPIRRFAVALCRCACGTEWETLVSNVKNGSVGSCGCSRGIRESPPINHPDGSISIPLTRGKFSRIDGEDFERVSKLTWRVGNGYAVSEVSGIEIQLHNFVRPVPDGFFNDHIFGDKLDNRKSKLRTCTHQQNCFSRKRPSTNTSGHKGVSWNKTRRKWSAYIKSGGKLSHLGYFSDKNDAADAYKEAAVRLHGEFARLD